MVAAEMHLREWADEEEPDWQPPDEFDISETAFAAQAEMIMAGISLLTEPWS